MKHLQLVGLLSRLPIIYAVRLTWELPTEVLQQSAAMELWIQLKDLELQESLYGVVYDHDLPPKCSIQQLGA